jgi:hypothetical protein
MSRLVTAINLIQAINSRVSEVVHCPAVDEYPASLDTMNLPIALTDIESGEFQGQDDDNQATDQAVIRVLFEALGQDDLGPKKAQGYEIYDSYRAKYLADDTYSQVGTKVICREPYRIALRPPFRGSGFTIIEYPVGTERWWHGFEIRFAFTTDWPVEC